MATADISEYIAQINRSARELLNILNNLIQIAQQIQTNTAKPKSLEPRNFTPEDFSFIALNEPAKSSDEPDPLPRVLQLADRELSFNQPLLEEPSPQPSINNRDNKPATAVIEPKHIPPISNRDRENFDIENLHRASLYPPLSRQSHLESNWTTAEDRFASISKIVAVHSFRGGTGKSNIASSLAVSLAKQGKRVGIVDTDLLSPGMHVLFGLQSKALGHTLNDYLRGDCLLHEAALNLSHHLPLRSPQTVKSNKGALYLVPASPKPYEIMRLTKERYEQESLTDGFRELIDRLNLDCLLIDTRSGISQETLQTLTVCSLLLVVLRPDYQDYQGTSVVLELARTLSADEIHIVINKVLPTFDINAYCEQLEATYDISIDTILPFYEDILQLASSDVFSLRYPHHPLTKAIDTMANRLASALNLRNPNEEISAISAI